MLPKNLNVRKSSQTASGLFILEILMLLKLIYFLYHIRTPDTFKQCLKELIWL